MSKPYHLNYPPFCSTLTTRSWSDVSRFYRYGFSFSELGAASVNTQEKDNEIAGEGNSYTADFWQYDGRIGNRFNLDVVVSFNYSNYHTFFNTLIIIRDENGDIKTIEKNTFTINTRVEGEVEALDKLSKKPDYVYIYSAETMEQEIGSNTSNTDLGINRLNILESQIDESDPKFTGKYTIAHEWGHRAGIWHGGGDLMSGKPDHINESEGYINYKEIRRIYRSAWPTYRGKRKK